MDQLTQAAQGPGQKGNEDHHIVWRKSENDTLQGIPRDKIYSADNVVRISTLKHWELTGWYRKPNPDFLDAEGNPMAPRDYLVGKDYDERRRVGLIGLRVVGGLK